MKLKSAVILSQIVLIFFFWSCRNDSTEPVTNEPVINTQVEPNLREVPLSGGDNGIWNITWEHSNKGFYYYGFENALIRNLYYYNNADNSIKTIQLNMTVLRILDISKDDQTLLLADSPPQQSNVYLFDVRSGSKTILIPARDSVRFNSGRFSPDESKIVFAGEKLITNNFQYAYYIFTQSSNSLEKCEGFSSITLNNVLEWLPNSNDKFYASNFTHVLYCFSVSGALLNSYAFPSDVYWLKTYSDENTAFAIRITKEVNSYVEEDHMYKYDMKGNAVKQLTFYSGETLFEYAVSPDGKYLVFAGYRDKKYGMWIITL